MTIPSRIRSSGAGVIAAAFAIALATPAPAQVADTPDANLPAVQAEQGPGVPYDGRIEIRLTPGTGDALARGGGWESLARGLQLVYEGERPVEAALRVALVTRDGEILESRSLGSVTVERGVSPLAARQIVFSKAEGLVPAAAYSPDDTYVPNGQGLPDARHFPDRRWDARHTVDDPGDGVRERGVMPGDNVQEEDERAVGIQVGRVDRQRGVEIDSDRFLVVTAVPTGPDAPGEIEVRPLIVDLDATGQTGNPLLAPSDKPDW